MPTVLLVEDDSMIRSALVKALANAGHVVSAVGTAMDALREVAVRPPDVVVLDLGLPDVDGASALRMMRGDSDVPIIVATARTGENNIIRLLNAGADDYLTKPFSGEHLLARISAVLRRRGSLVGAPAAIEVGPLRIDLTRRAAVLDGKPLDLNRKEFDLLAYLAARRDQLVTRQELVEEVWRQPYRGSEQTVDVHISWLRRKLGETAAKPRFLRVLRGVGIMLVDPT
ncbi:response regulator transcription factor [Planosporangium flavigriseum]|nr:response regulator transcription factor [Planosporangium flavigriseum]NJC66891.1 response regulator transcription factor [Planosporangium flavigriseum]